MAYKKTQKNTTKQSTPRQNVPKQDTIAVNNDQIKEMARQQAAQDVLREQQEQMMAIEQKTAEINQRGMNQAHEPEFSAYAEGTGHESLNNVTNEKVQEAYNILLKYREKKQAYDEKIADNEEFWKMNHWDVMESGKEDDGRIKPKSAWLFNTIINKHADAMDNYPQPNILPRARDDEDAAKIGRASCRERV